MAPTSGQTSNCMQLGPAKWNQKSVGTRKFRSAVFQMWHRIMHTRLIQQRWSNRVDVIFTTLGLLSLYARRAQQSKTAEEKSVSAFFIVLFIRVFTHALTFVLINLKHSSTPVIPRLWLYFPKDLVYPQNDHHARQSLGFFGQGSEPGCCVCQTGGAAVRILSTLEQ